jgi:uncharacterized delta-60 repeat protein
VARRAAGRDPRCNGGNDVREADVGLAFEAAPIRSTHASPKRAHSRVLAGEAFSIFPVWEHLMSFVLQSIRSAAAGLLIVLAACGGGGSEDSGPPPPAGTVVGATGGTVTGANGVALVIPAGALTTDVMIGIEQTSAGAPALPGSVLGLGPMFAFTPHGTTFALPVTVTIPFDSASAPAGVTLELYKTNAQNEWEPVPGAVFGAISVTAQITGFSHAQPVRGVQRGDPIRLWTMSPDNDVVTQGPLKDCAGLPAPLPSNCGEPLDLGGEVHEIRTFFTDRVFSLDDDPARTLEAFSSADGVTFWVSAEDVGLAELRQSQKFIKRSEDATLQFVITQGRLEATDGTQLPTADECPRGLDLSVCHPLLAVIRFEASATTPLGQLLRDSNGAPALDTAAYINLIGRADLWDFSAANDGEQSTVAWQLSDFELTKDVTNSGVGERHPRALLRRDLVFNVDLSRLKVGDDFRVVTRLVATASNKRGRETAVAAYLRDPAKVGGSVMNFTGLLPVADDAPNTPTLRPAAPCTTGPDPAAGVLQFNAASYALLEGPFAALSNGGVFVTRTQGSTGAVSATVDAGGGSAAPGVHYTPLSKAVHFADGDTAPRLVNIDLPQNTGNEADTTVNLALSAPGGCATLGAQASAVLTILDDDRLPPPQQPSGLDLSFGNAGKADTTERGAASTAFGGDRSAMALQADGKIVMVGGTFTDFILARFNADGSLDAGFGADGKVVTDMGSGLRQEEALAVAIQSDGKIVVVGHTAIDAAPPAPDLPPTFAITRYNSDGSLDTSFGTGGKVSGSVNGIARAVAIQPDGKIVLAGEFELALSNGTFVSDFTVARFNVNGSLDLAFGTSGTGQVATDIGGAANSARNLVLQPNGAIVVSGTPQCSQLGCDHTDMVRYAANGTLDASFGSGGTLTLADATVGEGLVRQADGKLVLVGSVVEPTVPATARFVLMRRNADGSPDTSFGTAGTASTALSENATASGIALQADGKFVVVGTRAFSSNSNFIVARYDIRGSLDTDFANAGALSIDFFGSTDIGESVLVQPDGKIVVGGQARNTVDGYGLARINP